MTQNLHPHPEIKVTVELEFESQPELEAIIKALIPDNINFPTGLSMNMSHKGKFLSVEFSSNNNISPDTITATVDEVLEHISVANRVIG